MNRPKRLLTRAKKPEVEVVTTGADRVTNESVSKHREEMLSRARKFKYPFYRSKHRVALTSISLVLFALALLGIFTSWRLYISKNTSEFSYRVTQILPFPVARADGEFVSYENYLFQLRHNVYWLEQFGTTDLRSPDGERQINYLKRLALDKAIESTIANRLADENNISVTKEEVDSVVNRVSASGGDLDSILKEQYNLTEKEYRRLTEDEILKAKVAKVADKEAPEEAKKVLAEIKAGKKFDAAAKQYSDDDETKQLGGEFGVVEKGKANLPVEVSDAVFKLKKGQVSGVIETPNDYFIVKVLEKPSGNKAKIALIRISVKSIPEYVAQLKKDGKVRELIKLAAVTQQ